MKFEDTLTRLRSALYDSEVRPGVTRLKRTIYPFNLAKNFVR